MGVRVTVAVTQNLNVPDYPLLATEYAVTCMSVEV